MSCVDRCLRRPSSEYLLALVIVETHDEILDRKRVDTRLRYDRTERCNLQWQWQREDLIAAYLQWQAGLSQQETASNPEEDPLPPFDMILIDFFGKLI